MKLHLKGKLEDKIQEFLDENADDIGACCGIWQDTAVTQRNAALMAEAASLIVDAQELQSDLEAELNPGNQ